MLNTEKSIWNCSQYDIYPIKKRPKKILAQNITPAQKAPWQTGSSMGHIILCFLRISLFSSKGKTKRICSVYGTMRKMPLLKILLDIPEKKNRLKHIFTCSSAGGKGLACHWLQRMLVQSVCCMGHVMFQLRKINVHRRSTGIQEILATAI